MNRLRSPHVVNFIGASYIPGKLCVLTEFMEKGSLHCILTYNNCPNNWQSTQFLYFGFHFYITTVFG